ncbi:hypothetical protein WN982_27230 [Paraburkholderia sp. IMGN_8]|uniref:hypothetical protein n=1 Tax=Paraburkholderia sp. IMGN_8 TaxID=3136564 RepID=UPI0031010666
MEQYIDKQFNTDAAIPRGAEVDAITEKAVDYAVSILNEVWECHTLEFWHHIDSNDVYSWMQEDEPELAESIRTRDLKQKFHRRLKERLHLSEQAESMVSGMKPLDLQAILAQISDEAQIDAVKQYISEKAYVNTKKWQYGQGWEDDEDYADDWDDTEEDDAYEDFAIETIAREALRIIIGRQQRLPHPRHDSKYPFIETDDVCAIIDEVRNSLASPTSFYVINDRSLPVSLQGKSREKRCIVVRVADQWLADPTLLCAVEGFKHRFVRIEGNVAPVSVFSVGINALWLDAQKAYDIFRLMRHELPILYVGSVKSVLVAHPYTHFDDLRYLWVRTLCAERGCQEVTPQQFETRFPDCTVAVPAVKRNMVDLT